MGMTFYLILNMSLASCFVIAAMLLLRLCKRLQKRLIYPLWGLVFLRLIVPFTPASGWSLFNFTGDLVKRLIPIEAITHPQIPVPASDHLVIMNMIGAAESYAPFEYKTNALKQVFVIGSIVWAIIAVAALLAVYFLYILTCRELKKAVLIKDNIYRSDMLLSPVLMGVFRPKIILPTGLDPDSAEGRMILAHENVHHKRLDNLWRTLAAGIACIHWFNPLVWVMLKMFFEDMELSCDETVLRYRNYSTEERKTYAFALLRYAEDKRVLVSSAFGRSGVRVRIVNVLNYKRMTVIGAVASAVFLLVVALVLITNPSLRG